MNGFVTFDFGPVGSPAFEGERGVSGVVEVGELGWGRSSVERPGCV